MKKYLVKTHYTPRVFLYKIIMKKKNAAEQVHGVCAR